MLNKGDRTATIMKGGEKLKEKDEAGKGLQDEENGGREGR